MGVWVFWCLKTIYQVEKILQPSTSSEVSGGKFYLSL